MNPEEPMATVGKTQGPELKRAAGYPGQPQASLVSSRQDCFEPAGKTQPSKSQSGRQDSNLRPSAPKAKGGISGHLGNQVIARDLGDAVLPCPAWNG